MGFAVSKRKFFWNKGFACGELWKPEA